MEEKSIGIAIDLGNGVALFVRDEPTTASGDPLTDQERALHILNEQKNKFREALEQIDELSNKGCEEWTLVGTLTEIDKVLDKIFGRQ